MVFRVMRAATSAAFLVGVVLLGGCATVEPGEEGYVDEAMETTSAPSAAAPTISEVFAATGPSVEDLRVASSGSEDEIVAGIVRVLSEWGMAGANEQLYDLQFEGEYLYMSLPEYSAEIAKQTARPFEAALYDGAESPEIAAAITEQLARVAEIAEAHFQTYGDQNEERYQQRVELLSVDSVTDNFDGTFTYQASVVETNNSTSNLVVDGDLTHEMYLYATVDISGDYAYLTKPLIYTAKM